MFYENSDSKNNPDPDSAENADFEGRNEWNELSIDNQRLDLPEPFESNPPISQN